MAQKVVPFLLTMQKSGWGNSGEISQFLHLSVFNSVWKSLKQL